MTDITKTSDTAADIDRDEDRQARNVLIAVLLVVIATAAGIAYFGLFVLGLVGVALTVVTFVCLLGFTASK